MYARMAFAEAAAAAHRNAEQGLGFAIRDEQGRFFCGFRQDNGDLVHGAFTQNNQGWSKEKERFHTKQTPVFLTLEEMAERKIGAAVFGMIYEVNTAHGLPDDLAESCKRYVVRKDMTHKTEPDAKQRYNVMSFPVSVAGLASADACAQGWDDGYIGFFYGFKKGLKRLLGPLLS